MPIQAAAGAAAGCLCSKRSLHSKPPPAASTRSHAWGRPKEPRRATISNPQPTPAQPPPLEAAPRSRAWGRPKSYATPPSLFWIWRASTAVESRVTWFWAFDLEVYWAGCPWLSNALAAGLPLNKHLFHSNLRLNSAISASDFLARKTQSPSCSIPQQLSPAIAAAIAGDLKLWFINLNCHPGT